MHQGEVTLENRGVRLLGNQVICLPNQVTLALLNPQEAAIVWGNAYGEEKETCAEGYPKRRNDEL